MNSRNVWAAIFDAPGQPLRVETVNRPAIQQGEALVRVSLCTVCGSDLHTFTGRRKEKTPSVLGHEPVGVVEEVGSDLCDVMGEAVRIGDRVVWAIAVSCGECFFCLHGLPQKCESLRKYGHEPITPQCGPVGGLATHCHLLRGTVIVKVPAELPDEVAAPAGCATATVAAVLRAGGICIDPRPTPFPEVKREVGFSPSLLSGGAASETRSEEPNPPTPFPKLEGGVNPQAVLRPSPFRGGVGEGSKQPTPTPSSCLAGPVNGVSPGLAEGAKPPETEEESTQAELMPFPPVEKAEKRSGSVVVFGLGMLGLTACAWADSLGFTVIVCDVSDSRLAQAVQFGAKHLTKPDSVLEVVKSLTDGRGADVALELSGSPDASWAALEVLRIGGTAVWAGAVFPTSPVSIFPESVIRRCLTITGVHNYAPRDLAAAVQFLANNHTRFPFSELVTKSFPLANVNDAFHFAEVEHPVRIAVACS